MLNICRTLLILFAFSSISFATNRISQPTDTTFTSAEHIAIGDEVKLRFSKNDEGKKKIPLNLPNGLKLSYGFIISMGDFYGDASQPISKGQTKEEMQVRFMNAFKAFTYNADVIPEINSLIKIMKEEQKYIEDGMKQGEDEEDLYEKVGLEYDRQYNCATGGGCAPSSWWAIPGRYLMLMRSNFDHFGTNAVLAYNVGHDLAIQEAIAAHHTKDPKRLQLAYAMNAFACHFLSDRYATGHMRTPREKLASEVTPSTVGSLLASFMHSEENLYGLNVHNQLGDKWIAYGDKSYFSHKNIEHRIKQLEVMQMSADQVFFAYLYGVIPDSSVERLIPEPDEIKVSIRDIAPLFYWDETKKKLMRRKELKKPYDAHWTDDWWGWSTLLALYDGKTIPLLGQAELAQSDMREKALEAGLITDKNVLNYIRNLKQ